MKLELIQPFINAADAVLAEGLRSPVSIASLTMEEETYRRKGIAALVWVSGDIEGRMVIDLDPATAVGVASRFAGEELPASDNLVKETLLELSNQVVGNAITSLNDQGFHFHTHPPVLHTCDQGLKGTEDTEALVICLETSVGSIYMNIAMRYRQPALERAAAAGR